MKYEKILKINIGNYQSLSIGATDGKSFKEIDAAIIKELQEKGYELRVDDNITKALAWYGVKE